MDTFRKIVGLEAKALAAQAENQFEESIHAHTQALGLARELNRPRLIAVLCNRMGEICEASSQIQRAVVFYESGLKALQGGSQGDLDGVIHSLQSAVKGFDQGYEFLEALDLYSESTSEDLKEAEEDEHLVVKLLINIGNAYLRQPQMTPALN